jgi:exosortase/archaeosortase family protein
MEPIALFVAAVIAVQVSLMSKLIGLVVGVPLLVLVNLVRIIALTIVSVRFSERFETAHVTVGQTVFIVCTLCVWFAWVTWATRKRRRTRAAPLTGG